MKSLKGRKDDRRKKEGKEDGRKGRKVEGREGEGRRRKGRGGKTEGRGGKKMGGKGREGKRRKEGRKPKSDIGSRLVVARSKGLVKWVKGFKKYKFPVVK